MKKTTKRSPKWLAKLALYGGLGLTAPAILAGCDKEEHKSPDRMEMRGADKDMVASWRGKTVINQDIPIKDPDTAEAELKRFINSMSYYGDEAVNFDTSWDRYNYRNTVKMNIRLITETDEIHFRNIGTLSDFVFMLEEFAQDKYGNGLLSFDNIMVYDIDINFGDIRNITIMNSVQGYDDIRPQYNNRLAFILNTRGFNVKRESGIPHALTPYYDEVTDYSKYNSFFGATRALTNTVNHNPNNTVDFMKFVGAKRQITNKQSVK